MRFQLLEGVLLKANVDTWGLCPKTWIVSNSANKKLMPFDKH